jgi:serine/threonine protein kinase
MEYCELGNLKLFLKTELAVMFAQPSGYIDLLRQILSALSCLEDMGIVHLDINMVNVFVARGVKNETIFKLGDFGCARKANMNCYDFDAGTGAFAAPETVMEEEDYIPTASADIFSTGMTMIHAILHLESRFILPLTRNRTPELIWQALEFIQTRHLVNEFFVELLRFMVSPIPEQRPSVRFIQANLEKCA